MVFAVKPGLSRRVATIPIHQEFRNQAEMTVQAVLDPDPHRLKSFPAVFTQQVGFTFVKRLVVKPGGVKEIDLMPGLAVTGENILQDEGLSDNGDGRPQFLANLPMDSVQGTFTKAHTSANWTVVIVALHRIVVAHHEELAFVLDPRQGFETDQRVWSFISIALRHELTEPVTIHELLFFEFEMGISIKR